MSHMNDKNGDIHSVSFDQNLFSEKKADTWLARHNMISIKGARYTANTIRYRLVDPKKFKTFSTHKILHEGFPIGIHLVIGYY